MRKKAENTLNCFDYQIEGTAGDEVQKAAQEKFGDKKWKIWFQKLKSH